MNSVVTQEVEHCVRKKVTWPNLPFHIKQVFKQTSKEYDNFVFTYSVRNQLRWRGNIGKYCFFFLLIFIMPNFVTTALIRREIKFRGCVSSLNRFSHRKKNY